MRLFVSINLGEELNRYLVGVQEELVDHPILKNFTGSEKFKTGYVGAGSSAGCGGVRLALAGRKSGFHLTLFFLGEVEVEKVLGLQRELKAISFEPFKLRFKKRLGVFKGGGFSATGGRGGGSRADGRFIKAVFVDIDMEGGGFSKLLNLQKKVTEAVGKFGFKDERAFSPHITLARVGFCPADRAAEFERAVLSLEVSGREFECDSFCLMESELGAGGSKYSEVLKVGLN